MWLLFFVYFSFSFATGNGNSISSDALRWGDLLAYSPLRELRQSMLYQLHQDFKHTEHQFSVNDTVNITTLHFSLSPDESMLPFMYLAVLRAHYSGPKDMRKLWFDYDRAAHGGSISANVLTDESELVIMDPVGAAPLVDSRLLVTSSVAVELASLGVSRLRITSLGGETSISRSFIPASQGYKYWQVQTRLIGHVLRLLEQSYTALCSEADGISRDYRLLSEAEVYGCVIAALEGLCAEDESIAELEFACGSVPGSGYPNYSCAASTVNSLERGVVNRVLLHPYIVGSMVPLLRSTTSCADHPGGEDDSGSRVIADAASDILSPRGRRSSIVTTDKQVRWAGFYADTGQPTGTGTGTDTDTDTDTDIADAGLVLVDRVMSCVEDDGVRGRVPASSSSVSIAGTAAVGEHSLGIEGVAAAEAAEVVFSTITMACAGCPVDLRVEDGRPSNEGSGTFVHTHLCECRPAWQLNNNYNHIIATNALLFSSLAYSYTPIHQRENKEFAHLFANSAVGKQIQRSMEPGRDPIHPASMLILGLGGGELHSFMRHYYPQIRVVTVELSHTVVEEAQRLYGVDVCAVHDGLPVDADVDVDVGREADGGADADAHTHVDECMSQVVVGPAQDVLFNMSMALAATDQGRVMGRGLYSFDYLVSDIYDLGVAYWVEGGQPSDSGSSNPAATADVVRLARGVLHPTRGLAMVYVHRDGRYMHYRAALREGFADVLELAPNDSSSVILASIKHKISFSFPPGSEYGRATATRNLQQSQLHAPCSNRALLADAFSEFSKYYYGEHQVFWRMAYRFGAVCNY